MVADSSYGDFVPFAARVVDVCMTTEVDYDPFVIGTESSGVCVTNGSL